MEKLVETSRNSDNTTGISFGYLYHQNYYELISLDLPRQTNMTIIPQQISCTKKFPYSVG